MPATKLKVAHRPGAQGRGLHPRLPDRQVRRTDEQAPRTFQPRSTTSASRTSSCSVFLKYGPDGERVIRHIERYSQARPPRVPGLQGRPARARRPGHRDPEHQQGRDERPPGQARTRSAARCCARCGDRWYACHPADLKQPRSGLQPANPEETTMSRIGKQPVAIPAGVKVAVEQGRREGRRAEGQARAQPIHPNMKVESDGKKITRHAAGRRAAEPGPARPDARPDQQHGRRRHQGLREEAEDRGRRLPGGDRRQGASC